MCDERERVSSTAPPLSLSLNLSANTRDARPDPSGAHPRPSRPGTRGDGQPPHGATRSEVGGKSIEPSSRLAPPPKKKEEEQKF